MDETLRTIFTKKGFDFKNGFIGRTRSINNSQKCFTGVEKMIEYSDPIMDERIPHNTKEIFHYIAVDNNEQYGAMSNGND